VSPTQPRSAAAHYADAERLLEAAPETPNNAVALATAHALLALAPRRARRVKNFTARHAGNGLPPHLSWSDES
jgi:hypothetical protein